MPERQMRLVLVVLSVLPTLAACVTTDQAHNQRCLSMGYRPGTPLYLNCREFLAVERERRAARLIAAGAALQQAAQPPRPVMCSTMGGPIMQTTVCQ